MRQTRKRLTYANVTATIALKGVKTGQLGRNAVRTGKIALEAVRTGKIGPGAITNGKLADDSVTGPKVKESTLGQVPSAANADRVGGHSAACPAGAVLIRGVCFDSAAGGPTTSVQVASDTCRGRGGYLPIPLELRSTRDVLDLGAGVYTDSAFIDGAVLSTIVVDAAGTLTSVPAGEDARYICAYPLVR